MRTDVGVVRAGLDRWSPEMLRLTAFIHGNFDSRNVDWITQLFEGREPESDERKGPVRTQTLRYDNGVLAIISQPGLVHCTLIPTDDEDAGVPGVSYPDLLASFLTFVPRWLQIAPAIQRIAYGGTVKLPVESREEGYAEISHYLNFDLDPATSRDFSFQINRPRRSVALPNAMMINRLSRWSVALVRTMIFPSATQVEPRHFCRLEFDINTDAKMTDAIDAARLIEVFHELVDCAEEIIVEGDIP